MCRPLLASLLLLATAPVALAGEEVRPGRDRVVRLPGLAVPVEIACEFDIFADDDSRPTVVPEALWSASPGSPEDASSVPQLKAFACNDL